MDLTLQKTFTFILFILIGLLLKTKFNTKEEVGGIKKIILNLALPATIFIALLGIEIDTSLFLLPILALGLNLVLFFFFPFILPLVGIKKRTPNYRTAKLLVPSLAPGLSCFPFIVEFLGEPYLAKAAMADLGNKFFVLVILYIIAMNWHYKIQTKKAQSQSAKLKSLFISMVSEPVNIFIAAALLLVSFGLHMDSMPYFLANTLDRLSILMTPLVLLFIGLAVKVSRKQFSQIFSMLLLRAGFVVFLCAIGISLAKIAVQEEILLFLAFSLSACSFWPYAHIAAVDSQEKEVLEKKKTFNGSFGISILALSFPLSTILILGILSSGTLFSSISSIFILAGILLLVGLIPVVIGKLKVIVFSERIPSNEKEVKPKYQVPVTEES